MHNSNYKLSIIIPTIKYSKYLDIAINSVLKLNFDIIELVVSINSYNTKGFENSKFFDCNRVKWVITNYFFLPADSFNFGINNSSSDWLYILGDDDILLPNFLKNVEFKDYNENDLIGIRLRSIDSNSNILSEEKPFPRNKYNTQQAIKAIHEWELKSHIGLFIFHRNIYNKVGGFKQIGFDNGYYVDTLFQFKVFSLIRELSFRLDVQYARRLHEGQGSAMFYHDLDHFYKCRKLFFNELKKFPNTYNNLIKLEGNQKNLYDSFLIKRAKIDLSKLLSPIWKDDVISIKGYNLLIFLLQSDLNNYKKIKLLIYSIIKYIKGLIINIINK